MEKKYPTDTHYDNFMNFLSNIDEAIIITDIKGNIKYCNKFSVELSGYTEKDLKNKNIKELYDIQYVTEIEKKIDSINDVKRNSLRYPIIKNNSENIPVKTFLWYCRINGTPSIYLILKTLPGLKEYKNIFNKNPSLMCIISIEDGKILEVNNSFSNSTGYPKKEIIGKKLRDLNFFNDEKILDYILHTNHESGKAGDYDIVLKKKNGDLLEGILYGEITYLDSTKVFLTVIIDITNLRDIEKELILMNESLNKAKKEAEKMALEAKNASDAKTNFLANMSHEIRTPLNGVIGFTELLLNTELTPVQKRYLENMYSSANILLDIINDILDISKIESEKFELHISKTDIIELLEQTVEIIKFSASKKNLEILLHISPYCPRYIFVDPVRIKQVVTNLLSNAIKFTDSGYVEISLLFKKNKEEQKKGKFLFSVKDTGIGIPTNSKQNLFKSFSQADSSTSRKYGGTGLGLAISKSILEKMRSSIDFESQLGKGSKFFFEIETHYEDLIPLPADILQSLSKILITGQSKNNHKYVVSLLKSWNLNYEISENFSHCEIKLSEFECIIEETDTNFFKTEDYADKIINKEEEYNNLPIIFLIPNTVDMDKISSRFKSHNKIYFIYKTELLRKLFKILYTIGNNNNDQLSAKNEYTNIDESEKTEKTIMIAEDVEMNMELLKTIIESYYSNIKIIEAKNGKEAVEKFKIHTPSIILMDIHMPEMDGYQATREIRKIQGLSDPTIIALTAGVLKGEKEKSYESGMDGFLTKPIKLPELKKIIETEFKKNSDENNINHKNPNIKSFDKEFLMEISGGSTDIYNQIIDLAVMKIPNIIKALEKAIDKSEIENIKLISHSLKGAAKNSALLMLAYHAEKMQNIDSQNTKDILENMTLINKEWIITKKVLEENKIL